MLDDPYKPVDVDKNLETINALHVYALLREMNGKLMEQSRATNNNVAKLLGSMTNLQEALYTLINTLNQTRERRQDEEIEALEQQLRLLTDQLNEKKHAKVDMRSTSTKMRAVATQTLEEEKRKKQIDWVAIRQNAVSAGVVALVIGAVWGLISNAPAIGLWLKFFFGR